MTTTAAVDALREACRLAAAQALVPQLRHPRSSVAWTWIAVGGDGDPVARGLRVYERYGTCLSAFQRFVRTAAEWDATGDWDLTGAGPFAPSAATDVGVPSRAGELCP